MVMNIIDVLTIGYVVGFVLCFLYVVYSALFWNDDYNSIISSYFGAMLKMGGWVPLLLLAFVVSLLWAPALLMLLCLYLIS